jgi:hypothetical protein
MWICKHCKKSFSDMTLSGKANHCRWCVDNPKRKDYKTGSAKSIMAMNTARKNNPNVANQYTKARSLGITIPSGPNKGKPGTFTGRTHSKETKIQQREKALQSPHRRLRKKMIEYNGILLDSTWELELAKRLDEQGIKWERPEPIKWIDENGYTHNYFPDFFLTDYNLYLDPKNPHAFRVQAKKIECLKQQLTNLIFLTTIEDIQNFSIK